MIAVKQVAQSTSGQSDPKQQGMIKALKEEMFILKDIDHVNIVRYLGGLTRCARDLADVRPRFR